MGRYSQFATAVVCRSLAVVAAAANEVQQATRGNCATLAVTSNNCGAAWMWGVVLGQRSAAAPHSCPLVYRLCLVTTS